MDNFERSLFHNFVSEFFQYCREMTDRDEVDALLDLIDLFYHITIDFGVDWIDFDFTLEEEKVYGDK